MLSKNHELVSSFSKGFVKHNFYIGYKNDPWFLDKFFKTPFIVIYGICWIPFYFLHSQWFISAYIRHAEVFWVLIFPFRFYDLYLLTTQALLVNWRLALWYAKMTQEFWTTFLNSGRSDLRQDICCDERRPIGNAAFAW